MGRIKDWLSRERSQPGTAWWMLGITVGRAQGQPRVKVSLVGEPELEVRVS